MMQSPIYLQIMQALVVLQNLDKYREFQSHKPKDHHVCIPTMEAKDVTMHVLAYSTCKDPKYLLLLLIWASLYNLECYEVLKPVVTSLMSPKNVA